jgi:type II restriction enzyme
MDLRLPMHFAQGYKSLSQIVRRVSEPWGADHLYCCSCTSDRLDQQAANTRVSDFLCPECVERYQLKSHRGRLGRSILGSEYRTLMNEVLGNRSPSFFLLGYERPEWLVRNLLVIPRFAISPRVIIERKPLKESARRKRWTGYLLNVALVPDSAKIPLIVDGSEVARAEVRERFARIARIQTLRPEQRGWTLDVLRCVESLPRATFTLDEIYAFEPDLKVLYPENHHVLDKIRQQLQVLRDRGLLTNPRRGIWHRV